MRTLALVSRRLFWKLLLALWLSMILSITGVVVFMRFTGAAPPDDMVSLGPWPLVPFVSGGIAVLVIGVGLAWYLSRPLHQLRWAVRRVSEGHFDTRVRPLMGRRRDEIVDLAHEFDSMASQLQQLASSRKVLLHDISHELRSPLSRLQAAIGLLRQDSSRTPEMIDRIERESERLDALIEQLLMLHRLEGEGQVGARERVDVVELLHAIAEDADFEARAAGRSVRIEATEGFVAEVNGELIYRAFENVIRNAVKFSPEGATAHVHASIVDGGSALKTRVEDRGPGVPPEMVDAIFEPFTRVEGSGKVRGVGLGLTIAKRAVEAHGGWISAALRDGGGLVVTLWLPRNAR